VLLRGSSLFLSVPLPRELEQERPLGVREGFHHAPEEHDSRVRRTVRVRVARLAHKQLQVNLGTRERAREMGRQII